MEGFLLVDKPKGPSSFAIIRRVRAMLGVKKVGHAGTLDPNASGLLVICIGRYTKFAGLLSESDKIYEAVFRLGETTTTDDIEGEVVDRRSWDHLTEHDVTSALRIFLGKIDQVPPKFSAVKVQGKRAYRMARNNVPLCLSARKVEIFSISLISCSLPEITVRVHCSKGTYVRSLARDLGEVLNVGAFAKDIRRISSSGFLVTDAIAADNLDQQDLKDRVLIKEKALINFEKILLTPQQRDDVICGRKLYGSFSMSKEIAVAFCQNDPVAIIAMQDKIPSVIRVI